MDVIRLQKVTVDDDAFLSDYSRPFNSNHRWLIPVLIKLMQFAVNKIKSKNVCRAFETHLIRMKWLTLQFGINWTHSNELHAYPSTQNWEPKDLGLPEKRIREVSTPNFFLQKSPWPPFLFSSNLFPPPSFSFKIVLAPYFFSQNRMWSFAHFLRLNTQEFLEQKSFI